LLPTQLAGRGWSDNVQAFNARQMACTNKVGLLSAFVQQTSSSTLNEGGSGGGIGGSVPTVAAMASAMWQQSQRRQQQQHDNNCGEGQTDGPHAFGNTARNFILHYEHLGP
jgi:hypothetical protein